MTFLVGLAAVNTGNNLLYLVLAAMCSFIVVSGILSEQTIWRLAISRRLPPHRFAGEPFAMEVTVTNRKRWLPSFCVTIGGGAAGSEAYLLMVGPGETQTVATTHCLSRRGLHVFGGARVATTFPFGLFLKAIARAEPLEVLVYPRLRPLGELIETVPMARQAEHEQNRRGHGPGLYNLRDYRAGDEARAIHWKTSARQTRLMVQERTRDEERRMTIVVSQTLPDLAAAADLEAFERGIELAAALADDLLAKGYSVRLLTFDRGTGYGAGRAHLYRILRELALLQPLPHPRLSPAILTRLTPRPDEPGVLIRHARDPLWAGGRDGVFTRVFPFA